MKILKFIFALTLLTVFVSCRKDTAIPIQENKGDWCATFTNNTILLLRVDYMTNKFEGGVEQMISGVTTDSDTIPISVNYKGPGDFGNISLYYQPTNDLIFDGSIIWMGTGGIKYPKTFDSIDSYTLLTMAIDKPDSSRFKIIFHEFDNNPIDYSSIWNSISKLKILSNYLKSNKQIGLFLYTPSVGVGDPNKWDWFVIMSK